MITYQFIEKTLPEQLTGTISLPENGFLWIDCTQAELLDANTLITQLTGITINDRHIDDCMNPTHLCFFDSMQDYDLLIFRNLNLPVIPEQLATHQVNFILFEKILLTISEQDNAIGKTRARILEPGRRQPAQPETLLHLILNAIVDNFLALRVPLTNQFTYWQNKLLDTHTPTIDWKALLYFKANIHNLCTLYEEQQDALGKWRQNMEEDLTQSLAVRLTDLSSHILRTLQHARALESELESLMQLHYALLGKRTNEVMRVLTVISAIFLPLTLISNIFGMNFHYMFGLANPHGFYITLTIMIVLSMLQLTFFKWKRWI